MHYKRRWLEEDGVTGYARWSFSVSESWGETNRFGLFAYLCDLLPVGELL